nr:hypothetical protein [Candidatus Freyarchaeota archaeon]
MEPEVYVEKFLEIFPPISEAMTAKMKEVNKSIKEKDKKNPFGIMQKMWKATMEVLKKFEPEIKKKTGMTAEQFMSYQKEHEEEINAYLEEHPEQKEKMESLKLKVNINEL